ncbi:MAG TPA: hypothetical protein ENG83_06825 [Nitrospirae bacterium]|nr:adenosyl-chloride synthase [bacterium BMS3Abin06]HDH11894.1 hypothetical protein [Nitrospirota bacterium]HDZ02764.1 hypothetical protein [Nitrospirota bacterium]
MLESPIITLTTDFGLKDPFVGLMKGVILAINTDAKIIDITHNIQRHNIFEASQVMSMSYRYFPPTTIHLAVVDPEVGGQRRPLLVITEDHYFIGPDNGIFSPIFEECRSNFFKVINISSSHYFRPMSGSTFHGRDIFAPVAAWLSKGVDSHKFGQEIDDYVKIPSPQPALSNHSVTGEIVSIDNFGNAISNIKRDDLAKLASFESEYNFRVVYNNKDLPLVNYYAENKSPGLSSIINSFGHIELFVYRESAADKFNVRIGDSVTVTLV